MPCRFASSGTVATSRSASRAILALNVASNFLRDLVISVLRRLRQSRTLHTLTFGPISGVHFNPEFKDRTVWDVFQEERASLMALRGPFDGFVEKAVRASTTCLIMADHNRYSVDARVRRPDGAGALPCRTHRR